MGDNTTIQDIARELSVHKSTVSLALSGKGNVSAATRARVVAYARARGYVPDPLAQRLARGVHASQICLFSGGLDVGLTTEKILKIQQALAAVGHDAPIYTCPASSHDAAIAQLAQIRQICRQRPRAIVYAGGSADAAVYSALEHYRAQGGIVVAYDSMFPLDCDQVVFDREDNGYQAASHLLTMGHRKIGIGFTALIGPTAGTENDPETPRMRGFRRALAEFGIEPRREWIFHNAAYERGGSDMAAQFMRLSERPTAISIVNDYVALAFMVETMHAGFRIPDDVSVVSHDNQPIAAFCPVPLTSVTQPVEQIVHAVVEMLMERLDDRIPPHSPARTRTIRGELALRDSVARKP